jgi:hypothetical protein
MENEVCDARDVPAHTHLLCSGPLDEIEILEQALHLSDTSIQVATWMAATKMSENHRGRVPLSGSKSVENKQAKYAHTHARTHPASRRPDETMESATCLMSSSLMLHPK